MDQPLTDLRRIERRPEFVGNDASPSGETSAVVAYGAALVVPMLLCCLLPLLLAAGSASVVGAAADWLVGFGGIETAVGAVVAGAAGYGLVRWKRARHYDNGELPAPNSSAACCVRDAGGGAGPERSEGIRPVTKE